MMLFGCTIPSTCHEGKKGGGRQSAASNLPSFHLTQLSLRLLPARRPSDREVGLVLGFFGLPALASRRLAQALIKIGMVRFQMVDDLEVLFVHAAEIDPLDMDEPQQLANRLGHRT